MVSGSSLFVLRWGRDPEDRGIIGDKWEWMGMDGNGWDGWMRWHSRNAPPA